MKINAPDIILIKANNDYGTWNPHTNHGHIAIIVPAVRADLVARENIKRRVGIIQVTNINAISIRGRPDTGAVCPRMTRPDPHILPETRSSADGVIIRADVVDRYILNFVLLMELAVIRAENIPRHDIKPDILKIDVAPFIRSARFDGCVFRAVQQGHIRKSRPVPDPSRIIFRVDPQLRFAAGIVHIYQPVDDVIFQGIDLDLDFGRNRSIVIRRQPHTLIHQAVINRRGGKDLVEVILDRFVNGSIKPL